MTYQNNWKLYGIISISILTSLISWESHATYTLNDAVIAAHENNYSIQAQQENLKATRMARPKAYADLLPQANLTAQTSKTKFTKYNFLNTNPNSASYTLQLSQPLFNGGGTIAAIKNADYTIDAAELQYKSASNQLSIDVTTAYANIFYTRNNYELNQYNEKVLQENLELTRTRFNAGQVTITDVLQSESRLSQAVAQREGSYGDLKNAEATFERLVGYKMPENIDDVDVNSVTLPSTLDELLDISLRNNPSYLSAKATAKAAEYNINISVSKILPSISANAQYNRSDGNNILDSATPDSNTYSINVSVPLFQGGKEYADIAEKNHLAKQANFNQQELERKVNEAAIQSWSNYKTAIAVIKSSQENISAAQKAYEAVKEEALIGTRTTLDVLNAENELFGAKTALIKAKRDNITAVFTILQIMGFIDAVELGA